ncbi:MAG: Segregation and condensation protein A [Candidatus Magasanikbacteria bacterium GW2011_GWC2_37_14]|uniref:Segregation and condensation protein A n=1 Tax=Candidatus Magasanikbacteria bacterium GW2011_GWC2_37_14 TaxID=1619046 RepID=A0A0G0GB21_9BACT|nr:MAG: Segregation and condensation protein A [Candidatus Magasanikbacteria bacterium GW2011_GWC2_37_14]
METKYNIGDFSGPLDLLLGLIEEEELNINEVSLSQVTEQFLKYLEKIENKQPEELADFLLVASRLLLLKSKKLLPQFVLDEEEGPSLEEQLRLYKLFIDAAKEINKKWLSSTQAYFREEPARRLEAFTPPSNLSLISLEEQYRKLLVRLQPPKPLPQTHIDRTVLLEEKIKSIYGLLKKMKNLNFSEILNSAQNRTEVIVTFLALLELVKGKQVLLRQSNVFSDIAIEKV